MKPNLVVALALLFFFASAMQVPAQAAPREQETAIKEIRAAVSVIFQNLEKMDVDALFQSYSNSAGFILVGTDGSISDYQAAKNHNAEWFKALAALKVTTAKDEFRFLPGNIVICAWQGKFEMTIKTGVPLKIDPFGITFIFSKIDDHWRVVYQQSSALPPVPVPPTN